MCPLQVILAGELQCWPLKSNELGSNGYQILVQFGGWKDKLSRIFGCWEVYFVCEVKIAIVKDSPFIGYGYSYCKYKMSAGKKPLDFLCSLALPTWKNWDCSLLCGKKEIETDKEQLTEEMLS